MVMGIALKQKNHRCNCLLGDHHVASAHGGRHGGFTLIEIMVVVFILATLSLMAVLAVNQADDRRYSNEAEKLLDLAQSDIRIFHYARCRLRYSHGV